jgi:hypothetical protein
MLACENRRERRLPLADYTERERESHSSSKERACSRVYKREREHKTTKDS